MNKQSIGFLQGTFDIFHVGHLTFLEESKANCDYLIVGVNSDELNEEYKGYKAVMPFEERLRIIKAIKCVDEVCRMDDRDKLKAHDTHKFDILFIGGSWKGSEFYSDIEKELEARGIKFVYVDHIDGFSSTIIKQRIVESVPKPEEPGIEIVNAGFTRATELALIRNMPYGSNLTLQQVALNTEKELRLIRNVGDGRIKEIKSKLSEYGLGLAPEKPKLSKTI